MVTFGLHLETELMNRLLLSLMKECLFNLIICHSEGVGERTEKTTITQVNYNTGGRFC